MGLNNIYKTLFDIRILHHYFLDEGTDVYTASGSPAALQSRFDHNRKNYELSAFMRIVPTVRTQKVLSNYKALFRQYKDGIMVAIKDSGDNTTPFIPFDASFFLDFTIEITDQYFVNYTNTNWNNASNLVYLSNLDPAAYTPPTEDDLPAVPVAFKRLSQYNGSGSGTSMNINLLKDVDPKELNNKFGFIRIYLTGEPSEMSLAALNLGVYEFSSPTPELNMYLANRSTRWRFLENQGATIAYTSNPQPLTKNGYIKTPPGNGNQTRYPNPDAKLIVEDPPLSGTYYSEVFI